jgi:hypothetical protein
VDAHRTEAGRVSSGEGASSGGPRSFVTGGSAAADAGIATACSRLIPVANSTRAAGSKIWPQGGGASHPATGCGSGASRAAARFGDRFGRCRRLAAGSTQFAGKALHAISGWPKLIAPFLAQNIGWFIGGFCFIAGALFLIANTSGFRQCLVVFASLFGASAFLIWAGYQFRRNRPNWSSPAACC